MLEIYIYVNLLINIDKYLRVKIIYTWVSKKKDLGIDVYRNV